MLGQSVLDVHTPHSSFAVLHSLTEETVDDLFDKLSKKIRSGTTSGDRRRGGERVGPGWLKYEYNDALWNLDDDSDYAIFTWRQRELQEGPGAGRVGTVQRTQDDVDGQQWQQQQPIASSSKAPPIPPQARSDGPQQQQVQPTVAVHTAPTLHLHNPALPLPGPADGAYCNPAYYVFRPSRAHHCHALDQGRGGGGGGGGGGGRSGSAVTAGRGPASRKSGRRTVGSGVLDDDEDGDSAVPKLRKEYEKFHAENGVRTVLGSIGPVENVRMLLKAGHRHVYISRKFGVAHGFIPRDSAPGNHGYAGLISIGEWPITLVPSATQQGLGRRPGADSSHNYLAPPPGHGGPSSQWSHPSSPRMLSTHSLSAARTGSDYNAQQQSNHGMPYPDPRRLSVPLPGLRPQSHPAQSMRSMHTGSTYDNMSIDELRLIRKANRKKAGGERSYGHTAPRNGLKAVMVQVYLSEEPHFDVVLGRSFFEKRQVKISAADPTDVWCLDTGEKIECELVILKDGRGEIVTVT